MTPDGQRISWNNTKFVIGIDSAIPQDLKQGIYAAADTWNAAMGRQLIVLSENVETNMIYIKTSWDLNNPNEEANTTIGYVGAQIVKATVALNAYNFGFYYGTGNGVEMQSVMEHELGHALGLDHSTGIMQPSLNLNTRRVSISEEIISNMHCEY
jgi:predicted Zn-dependent protease